MRTIETEIENKIGLKHKIDLSVCECGSISFFIWQAENHSHEHMQCCVCNRTYCHNEDCGFVQEVKLN